MKFYGKAESVGKEILAAFERGDVPKALAQVFIHRRDNVPMRAWSFANQMTAAFRSTDDARGFKAWLNAGRCVKKGTHAFQILAPCLKKIEDKETGKEKSILIGFRSQNVHRIEDTEVIDAEKWAKHSEDKQAEAWLDALPLRDVAEAWGLDVQSYNGQHSKYYGYYQHGQKIALGVENLSTWMHELCHAADDRAGSMKKGSAALADKDEAEIVAEFGGAILLCMIGQKESADLGGCWDYIKRYASGDKTKALRKALALIKRTCNCIDLILTTADELNAVPELEAVA